MAVKLSAGALFWELWPRSKPAHPKIRWMVAHAIKCLKLDIPFEVRWIAMGAEEGGTDAISSSPHGNYSFILLNGDSLKIAEKRAAYLAAVVIHEVLHSFFYTTEGGIEALPHSKPVSEVFHNELDRLAWALVPTFFPNLQEYEEDFFNEESVSSGSGFVPFDSSSESGS
jgi:hypothetical protein